MNTKDYPFMLFLTQKEWEEWLRIHAEMVPGIWMKFAKKGSGASSITYDEALEGALCYGWIDGQAKRLDEQFYLNKFTPRGPRSIWSKRNCEIVERLIKEKKMQPPGLAKIEAAKKDGRWEQAYDSPKNMVVPEDFIQELKKHKKAYEFFLTLNKTNTYAISWKLATTKKPETRKRRMEVILQMLEKGEKLN